MTMKSKSNGNLSEERVSETKKEKGHKERERESSSCNVATVH